MAPAGFRKRQSGWAAALIAMPLGIATVYAANTIARENPPLQRLADEAALAGVNALAATQGQPDDKRIEASIAAARQAVDGTTGSVRTVAASPGDLSLSVVVAADPKHPTQASATARYIPPSEGSTSAPGIPVALSAPGRRARM